MVGKSGAGIHAVRHDVGNDKCKVEYSTIQCGLRRHLKRRFHDLLPHFQRASQTLGVYMYTAGLASNYIVSHNPNVAVDSWKTFYDRVLSGLDGSEKHEIHKAVSKFKHTFGVKLPPHVNFEMRQNESYEMSVAAQQHLKQFGTRLRSYLEHRVVDLQLQQSNQVYMSGAIASQLVQTACAPSDEDYKSALERLETALSKKKFTSDARSIVMQVVEDERTALGALVKQKLYPCNVPDKNLCKLLPHLQRYSNWNLEWCERYKEKDSRKHWNSVCSKAPKPFPLLPMFQLQPRHIHYTWSQFDSFMKWLGGSAHEGGARDLREAVDKDNKLEDSTKPSAKKRKRRTNEEVIIEVVKRWLATTSLGRVRKYAERWRAYAQRRKSTRDIQLKRQALQMETFERLFDLKGIKGKRGRQQVNGREVPKWRLNSFRTDGVQLCLCFVSGCATKTFGINELVDAGYDKLPVPSKPVDVRTVDPGIYRLTEKRKDISPLSNVEQLLLVPIDPGQVKPIQVAEVPAVECDSAKRICDYMSAHKECEWHITDAQWKEGSGRAQFEKGEADCRQRRPEYDTAISALRETRRRCASFVELENHCKVVFSGGCLEALRAQLVTLAQSKIRWTRTRRTVSYISKVADRIFDRASRRRNDILPKDQHQTRVAFMGDGTFGHQKGHAPVPKKKLVRSLAVRGPTVIMDEYNTSKMCPCGTSELKNVHESHRLCCHKTVGLDGPCCVECSLGAENMDRDVLAIINFLLCARCALDGKERPDHLRGPWRFQ